jgi:hypothetical protein
MSRQAVTWIGVHTIKGDKSGISRLQPMSSAWRAGSHAGPVHDFAGGH